MGMLDSIVGALSSAQGGAAGAQGDVLKLLGGFLNQPQVGGLPGLVGALTQGGLGDAVSSWVGKGANLPVSAEQILSALGGPLQSLSASTGQSSGQLASLLAEHLPGLVDQLTPHGTLPAQDPLGGGLSALKGLLG